MIAMATTRRRAWRPRQRYDHGFILIALLAMLAMGVLYFVTTQLEAFSLYQREAKSESDSLAQAREALLGYAATYRDDPAHSTEVFGYLPCPDTTGTGDAANSCGNAGEASVGLLPYKKLGLPDLRDGTGGCLWYAVAGSYKNNPNGPVMNWDTQGQFSVRDANGAVLIAPEDSQGGAAAVIFVAGAPLAGQTRSAAATEPCRIDPAQVAKYLDGANAFAPAAGTIALTQGPVKDAGGNVTSNDRMAWITPREIFDRVVKRQDFSNTLTASPPGQINTLIDRLAKALEKKIQDDIFNATTTSLPTNTASYTPQPAGAAMGEVNASTDIGLANAASYVNYLTNWSDQFRQIVCNIPGTPCLTINSNGCRGALVFAGRTDSGRPRTTGQKIASSDNLAHYFESGFTLLTNASPFTGSPSFSAATASAAATDVATCLGYGTFDSLKQGAAAFAGGVITPGGAGTGVATVTGVATATPAIVLGSAIAAARSGCVWRPSPLPLNSSLRLYFTYSIASASLHTTPTPRGFALALADAATNNPASVDPLMCGASDVASVGSLGYAGAPVSGTATVGLLPAVNITGTARVAGVVTIATADIHNFLVDDSVTITGASPTGYNGTYIITATPSSYAFSYVPFFFSGPDTPLMGIFPPKIGLEFDTYCDSGRNDPPSGCASPASKHHFAFVYWGGAGDNNPTASTRDGGDDNVHNSGVNGDGSQPLNPGALLVTTATATPLSVVAAARWTGSAAMVTTASPHGLSAGQLTTVSNVSPLGYKGAYNLATVPSATSFTYALAANPGAYPFVATVSAATWASNTAAITTPAAHGLSTGQRVAISNVSPAAWNGSYTITVQDATHFSFTLASNPGSYISGGQVSFPLSTVVPSGSPVTSWTAGTATINTAAMHGLISNQFVTISGISPSTYNGTYRINVSVGNQFTYALASNPGAYSSGGSIAIAGATSTVMASPVVAATLTSAVWAPDAGAGKVTVTTSAAHALATGQMVQIAGVYPPAYNGVYAITVIDATHFSYALASNPGDTFSASSFAYPGIATVKASDPFLPHGKTPYDTLIHVRVDISRSYDALRHRATLTLRAYVGDTFHFSGNCELADFRNFARDLAELCPIRSPTIEQDGITINDAAGPALANIYLGFTTARSAAASDNELVNIQNLILRSQ